MAGLALAPMATGVSKTCAKAAAIFPIAFLYHLTALASLPVQVALATARTIAGVKGRGVDELFASFFTPRGVRAGSKEDVELIEGLRERHGAAMAAVKDQLDDSETRYKVLQPTHTADPDRDGSTVVLFISNGPPVVADQSPIPHPPNPGCVRETSRVRAHATQDAEQAPTRAGGPTGREGRRTPQSATREQLVPLGQGLRICRRVTGQVSDVLHHRAVHGRVSVRVRHTGRATVRA